jgi:hypothetical protein
MYYTGRREFGHCGKSPYLLYAGDLSPPLPLPCPGRLAACTYTGLRLGLPGTSPLGRGGCGAAAFGQTKAAPRPAPRAARVRGRRGYRREGRAASPGTGEVIGAVREPGPRHAFRLPNGCLRGWLGRRAGQPHGARGLVPGMTRPWPTLMWRRLPACVAGGPRRPLRSAALFDGGAPISGGAV